MRLLQSTFAFLTVGALLSGACVAIALIWVAGEKEIKEMQIILARILCTSIVIFFTSLIGFYVSDGIRRELAKGCKNEVEKPKS